jgi:hypothetical protein
VVFPIGKTTFAYGLLNVISSRSGRSMRNPVLVPSEPVRISTPEDLGEIVRSVPAAELHQPRTAGLAGVGPRVSGRGRARKAEPSPGSRAQGSDRLGLELWITPRG